MSGDRRRDTAASGGGGGGGGRHPARSGASTAGSMRVRDPAVTLPGIHTRPASPTDSGPSGGLSWCTGARRCTAARPSLSPWPLLFRRLVRVDNARLLPPQRPQAIFTPHSLPTRAPSTHVLRIIRHCAPSDTAHHPTISSPSFSPPDTKYFRLEPSPIVTVSSLLTCLPSPILTRK